MTNDLTTTPAAELREWLDYVVWEVNGEKPLAAWRALLLSRPDADTDAVQQAVAVIDEYLAPHGSAAAKAAHRRAWPEDSLPGV